MLQGAVFWKKKGSYFYTRLSNFLLAGYGSIRGDASPGSLEKILDLPVTGIWAFPL